MSLSLQLDLKQTQSLVLTPQLQQAIRLLQLSGTDLAQDLRRELDENPFLELVDGTGESPADAGSGSQAAGSAGNAVNGAAFEHEDDDWPPREAPAIDSRRGRTGGIERSFDELAPAIEGRLSSSQTLQEMVAGEVGTTITDPTLRDLAQSLAAWLDADGYLRESDQELACALSTDETAIAVARSAIQRCEPTGIGARDLAECLALQLAERNRLDPAMQRLLQRLPLVARADWPGLQRWCRVEREDLLEMIAEIKALDPRPGSAYAARDPIAVVPDVVVERAPPNGWRVMLNGAASLRVRIDTRAQKLISAAPAAKQNSTFMSERLQQANWLSRALEQRSRTILRVAKAIFERQTPFLEHGPSALKPLVLRDIATALGLHESTVSRATSEKFAQTPHGTFALKYFFSTAIAGLEGDDHSGEAIRQHIKRLIQGEQPESVLSDDQLVTALRAKNIVIARRTVAKYREAMGIASSVMRRRAKALSR